MKRGGQLRRSLPARYVRPVDHCINLQRRNGEALFIRGVGNDTGQGHGRVKRRPVALAAKTQIDIDRFAVFQFGGRYIEIGDLVAHLFLPVVQGDPGVLDGYTAQGNCSQGQQRFISLGVHSAICGVSHVVEEVPVGNALLVADQVDDGAPDGNRIHFVFFP